MEWITNNWYLIIAAIAVVSYGVYFIIDFIKEPTDQKVSNVKEWLKYAVLKAEQELGSGTGQAKLRMVYGMAIDKFPWIANVMIFATFEEWVDEALVWLEAQLSTNKSIQNYVGANNENK